MMDEPFAQTTVKARHDCRMRERWGRGVRLQSVTSDMHETFQKHVESLPVALGKLLAMSPLTCSTLTGDMPGRGVYVFSEAQASLYVGRSNRMRERVRNHGSKCATYQQAAFAFKLAREATGHPKATYTSTGSRRELMLDPQFVAAFSAAKIRIGAMQVRFVEEVDPVRQCLLEIYVATSLGTRYNDFDNH